MVIVLVREFAGEDGLVEWSAVVGGFAPAHGFRQVFDFAMATDGEHHFHIVIVWYAKFLRRYLKIKAGHAMSDEIHLVGLQSKIFPGGACVKRVGGVWAVFVVGFLGNGDDERGGVHAPVLLKSTSRENIVSNSGVSRMAYMNLKAECCKKTAPAGGVKVISSSSDNFSRQSPRRMSIQKLVIYLVFVVRPFRVFGMGSIIS